MSLNQVIVITGPTACGKSDLAAELALRMGSEVVNSDSVQVYTGFDIGSGKPDAQTFAKAPHHLFSYLEPTERFDAWRFMNDAHRVIAEIHARGQVPVIVGGTGLYIRSLLCGLIEHQPTPPEIEAELTALELRLRRESSTDQQFAELFHAELQRQDPLAAQTIHPTDRVRMRRALECLLSTGTSIQQLREEHQHSTVRYHALVCCLLPDRRLLYPRIDARVDRMLSAGLVEEVRSLRTRYPSTAHPFGAIGYREVAQFLDGQLAEKALAPAIKQATRRFAKRQFTWWGNQPGKLGWRETKLATKLALPAEAVFQTAELIPSLERTIGQFIEQSSILTERGIAFCALGR